MVGCEKNGPARPAETDEPARVMPAPRAPSAQYFEYVGKASLSAFGPITGRHYRFAHPGAILAVDQRDAALMEGVSNLRRVPAPE